MSTTRGILLQTQCSIEPIFLEQVNSIMNLKNTAEIL